MTSCGKTNYNLVFYTVHVLGFLFVLFFTQQTALICTCGRNNKRNSLAALFVLMWGLCVLFMHAIIV